MAQQPALRRAVERLKTAQLRLAMLALVVMMMTIVIDVTLRYLFGRPVHGAYDVVEAALVIFVFHGLAGCFLSRQNIVIDLIDGIVSERVAHWLIRASDVATVGLLALIAWAMTVPALQAWDYGDKKLELGLPVWVLWGFAILGLMGALFCAVAAMFDPTTRRHGGERL